MTDREASELRGVLNGLELGMKRLETMLQPKPLTYRCLVYNKQSACVGETLFRSTGRTGMLEWIEDKVAEGLVVKVSES